MKKEEEADEEEAKSDERNGRESSNSTMYTYMILDIHPKKDTLHHRTNLLFKISKVSSIKAKDL